MSTSISGSGPAYVFLMMEAMIDAGVHMGFSRNTATTLVHHTLLGSTLYAMKTDEHPSILKNSVTSVSQLLCILCVCVQGRKSSDTEFCFVSWNAASGNHGIGPVRVGERKVSSGDQRCEFLRMSLGL